jgi:hypothetical protein
MFPDLCITRSKFSSFQSRVALGVLKRFPQPDDGAFASPILEISADPIWPQERATSSNNLPSPLNGAATQTLQCPEGLDFVVNRHGCGQ